MHKWFSFAAEFVNCRFDGLVTESSFFGTPWVPDSVEVRPMRVSNEFSGNDFRRADLRFVSFREGIDIDRQHLPESDEYIRLDQFPQRLTRARWAVAQWTDLAQRAEVLKFLSLFDSYSPNPSAGLIGQPVLFYRRHSGVFTREVEDAAWQVLETAI